MGGTAYVCKSYFSWFSESFSSRLCHVAIHMYDTLRQLLGNLYCIQNNRVRPKVWSSFYCSSKTTWATITSQSIQQGKGGPCGFCTAVHRKLPISRVLCDCFECNKSCLIADGVSGSVSYMQITRYWKRFRQRVYAIFLFTCNTEIDDFRVYRCKPPGTRQILFKKIELVAEQSRIFSHARTTLFCRLFHFWTEHRPRYRAIFLLSLGNWQQQNIND